MVASAGLDSLVRNIGIISRNNSVLASMLSHLTSGEEPTEPRDLRVLLQDTGHIARETGELLLSLQQNAGREDAPERQRSMLVKLNKDFQFVLRRFQQLAEQSAQHARLGDLEAAAGANRGRGELLGSGAGDDDEDDMTDERGPLLQAGVDEQQQRLTARANADAMEERERMISQVETTVVEVKEIFSDLATLVASQQTHIESISTSIENTAVQAERATGELQTASKYQAKTRQRKCLLYGVGLAFALFVILYIGVNLKA